jgi:multidrug efflux pump subunit AcrA (membrane-fusion protein)
MYGEIKFSLVDDANAPLIVPANAYIFRTAGAQVVMVAADGKVHWQTIQVGRDYGTEFEVLTGLKDGDKVVMNPTDDLEEGTQVTVNEAPPAGAGAKAQ